MTTQTLTLTPDLETLDNPANTQAIFDSCAQQFPKEIIEFANITPTSEHQLNNFGPGSAWLYETTIDFTINFKQNLTTLTLTK